MTHAAFQAGTPDEGGGTHVIKHVIRAIAILITGTCLLACGHNIRQDAESTHADTLKEQVEKAKKEREENARRRDEEYSRDSIHLVLALEDALNVADQNLDADNFKREYEIYPDDSSRVMIEVMIANLFDDHQKYVFLRRYGPVMTCLDLYKVANRKVERVLSTEEGSMIYLRDTIFDVNGDGARDFLVHWYPISGCCRRNNYDVYLNLPDKEKFSDPYNFINPTFYPKEHIIRGVEYGHPGDVGLYKYKWRGLDIDTLEFIHRDAENNQQFVKTKKNSYRPTGKDGMVLKAVPREYRSMDDYDWFLLH